jgi:hypothetical protein
MRSKIIIRNYPFRGGAQAPPPSFGGRPQAVQSPLTAFSSTDSVAAVCGDYAEFGGWVIVVFAEFSPGEISMKNATKNGCSICQKMKV